VYENTTTDPAILCVVPPVSESIGNTQCREVLMFEIGGTYINLRPVSEALLAYPQTIAFESNTLARSGGANTNSVTINGVTVSQSPAAQAGNTEHENLRYLYEALCSSSNASITDWTWQWNPVATQNANDTSSAIFGIRKTLGSNITVTAPGSSYGNGVIGGTSGNYCAEGLQVDATTPLQAATVVVIDLVWGFIIYLSVSKRAVSIASRCNSGYYGPANAAWGDHQVALDGMPTPTPGWERFLSPIELMVGVNPSEAYLINVWGKTAKAWALNAYECGLAATGTDLKANPVHPFTRACPRGVFVDVGLSDVGTTTIYGSSTMRVDYLFSGAVSMGAYAEIHNDWPIHRGSGNRKDETLAIANRLAQLFTPLIYTDDWWKYIGTAPNENLQFGPVSPLTTLSTSLARSGSETTITLGSTSGMPTTGAIVIEDEAITYTGISGSTITGCVRGAYGSDLALHVAGSVVSQGHYWIKINGGLIYCGLQQPS
jgi:hypothetical protein